MKELVNGDSHIEGEVVPAQDPFFLTIEGIPQEVIDELYDIFEDVIYDNYMKPEDPKRSKIKTSVFVADFNESGDAGVFQYFDTGTYKTKTVEGVAIKRYMIAGKKKDNTLDLKSVQEYNCIRTKED